MNCMNRDKPPPGYVFVNCGDFLFVRRFLALADQRGLEVHKLENGYMIPAEIADALRGEEMKKGQRE